MNSSPTTFRVRFNSLLRTFTKFRGDIEAWDTLIDNVKSFSFQSSHTSINVLIDWKDAKEFIAERKSHYFDSEEIKTKADFDEMMEKMNEYIRRKEVGLIRESLEIELSVYNSDNDRFTDLGYVINVLYQIFLAMNLAVPGSCDFYSAAVSPLSSDGNDPRKEELLLLTGSVFEGAAELGEKWNWPILQDLPIQKVLGWIQQIGLPESHFAHFTTERAIYGLLHVCNQTDISPSEVVWLAQALETLFDTPQAGISKVLRERIFLVLGEPSENSKKIKKAINAFYDYRSRYVHGEIPIPNPMSLRLSDSSLDDFINELMEHVDLAILLVVAALQKLIIQGGSNFEFSEAVSICKIPAESN